MRSSVLGIEEDDPSSGDYAVRMQTPEGEVKASFKKPKDSYTSRRQRDGEIAWHLRFSAISGKTLPDNTEELKMKASEHLHKTLGIVTRRRAEELDMNAPEVSQ